MEEVIQLTHKEFLNIYKDPERAAKAVDLLYIMDSEPGIARIKKGKSFSYRKGNSEIRDKNQIERIRKLVIPPAWTQVWICPVENGHLQATGLDVLGRKQYKYHGLWHRLRNETKFHRLLEFGNNLPVIRRQVEKDLCSQQLNEKKVLATVIALMERTYIRIGNSGYEKMYGSYGLTTMKDGHVLIKGSEIQFSFKGKKGIYHKISLRSSRLAKIVRVCRDIPGKELFQYYDEQQNRRSIDSGMVNDYIREISGKDFTAKDFRTWAGTVAFLGQFRSLGVAVNASEKKKNILTALEEVSKKLGNSRTICRKYYVHPGLIRMYEEDNLDKYIAGLNQVERCDELPTGLTEDEKILMKILKELK